MAREHRYYQWIQDSLRAAEGVMRVGCDEGYVIEGIV
jgi:hypothetical protein